MPGGYQQGGRNGRFENDQSRLQGRGGQQGHRSAGGRSEENARQRDDEQMRAGYPRDDWRRQQPTHNVRSEPHWDPNDLRGREQTHGHSRNEWQSAEDEWRPAQGARSGGWEDDRYTGTPSYEPRQQQGARHWYDERNFSGRERWRDEQDDRGYQNQGYNYQGYNQLRGGQGGSFGRSSFEERFTRGSQDPRFSRGGQHDISGQQDYGRGELQGRNEEHESFGQQLQDAGRRLVGKVKRMVRNPKNYKRTDERIREDVCDRLAMSDEVDPTDVEVTVQGGEVTLTGTVDSRHQKFLAEEIADDVAGVHDVHNQLRIRRQDQQASNSNSTLTSGTSPDASRRNVGRS